jgi:hypothetical protein
MRLFEEYRYFFYITNDREMTADEVVFSANDRCDQENLIAELKNGVRALTTPADNLVSNWAYMVMGSLAWSLKAWSALLVPVSPRHQARHEAEKRTLLRMEFTTYRAAFIQMPCQIMGADDACFTDCYHGIHGRGFSCGWSSASTNPGYVEPRANEVGVWMPRSVWATNTEKRVRDVQDKVGALSGAGVPCTVEATS